MLARTESKGTTPSLLVGVQSCIDTVENSVVVPEEDRIRSIPISSCITFVYISKRRPVPTNKYLFNYLHPAVFILFRNWKQPIFLSKDEQIKKLEHLC